jgi:hypothetical protein
VYKSEISCGVLVGCFEAQEVKKIKYKSKNFLLNIRTYLLLYIKIKFDNKMSQATDLNKFK